MLVRPKPFHVKVMGSSTLMLSRADKELYRGSNSVINATIARVGVIIIALAAITAF